MFTQSQVREPDKAEFELFRHFLEDACGINLPQNKQYLIVSRVRKILAEHEILGLTELVERLKRERFSKIRVQVVDAMTTNETFWFRDVYPFEYLKTHIFPELLKQDSRQRIRLWSAACSSGQEPFSLAMTVEEFKRSTMGVMKREVEILATDLSPTMLASAKSGEYDALSMGRGLSAERLGHFFDKGADGSHLVKPIIKRRIQFKPHNLKDSHAAMGKFDIIFCRNVLIYFSAELKTDIIRRFHASLNPGGVLFLGSSEGIAGVSDLFDMVNCNPGIMYRAK